MRTKSSTWNVVAVALTMLALFGVAAAVRAHEGHHHQAKGTIERIHENHLMLTIAAEKEQTFVLGEATKYLRGRTPTTKKDLVVGERAVVMYETKDGADHALEVKLGEK
jgi:hypothetical protein